jgi:hypothetical protein
MAQAAAAAGMAPATARTKPAVSRLDRRKARTRQALVDAAVRLVAEGRGDRASIQEITEAADIEQLFQTASEEALERWGQMLDRACAGIEDPAEVFALSLRVSGRLAWTHPDLARFLTGLGLDALDTSRGLAPRALRDIKRGQAAGRFTICHADIALSAVAGGLLGLLHARQQHPRGINETAADDLAEAMLRMLGIPPSEARRIAASDLPAIEGL